MSWLHKITGSKLVAVLHCQTKWIESGLVDDQAYYLYEGFFGRDWEAEGFLYDHMKKGSRVYLYYVKPWLEHGLSTEKIKEVEKILSK